MSKDPEIWKHLLEKGYIQFGRGSDTDYDPVCFDISSRTGYRDYRVVIIDHEGILCHNRVKVVKELAPSFEALISRTVDKANRS